LKEPPAWSRQRDSSSNVAVGSQPSREFVRRAMGAERDERDVRSVDVQIRIEAQPLTDVARPRKW
jgi:hypothetical protein